MSASVLTATCFPSLPPVKRSGEWTLRLPAVLHVRQKIGLTIGARLTLVGESSGAAFEHSQVELGVEAGVVLALTVALLMLRGRAGEKTSRPGRAQP